MSPSTALPFTHSLLAAVAAAASPALGYLAPVNGLRQLWLGAAREDAVGPVGGAGTSYLVATPYGTPRGLADFAGRVSIQWRAVGPSHLDAMALALRVTATLSESDGSPRGSFGPWAISGLAPPTAAGGDGSGADGAGGWVVRAVRFVQGPSPAGGDDAGRVFVSFNTDIHFSR